MKRGKVADVTAGAHGGQRAGTGSHPGHRCTALNTSSAALSFGSDKGTKQQAGGTCEPTSLKHSSYDSRAPGDRHTREPARERPPSTAWAQPALSAHGTESSSTSARPSRGRRNGPEFKTLLCKPLTRPSVNGRISRVVSTHSGISRGLKNENYSDMQHR